jgi:15-cis-phytoene synthase
MNIEFYFENSYKLSELITKNYSTSFSLAVSLLEKDKRKAIYAVYGFVRLADEIVDSFYRFNRSYLLKCLDDDLRYALFNGISANPVVAAFSDAVLRYHISYDHINAFMDSMKSDITKKEYKSTEELNTYVYGSADVVGLMCLKVFCNGDPQLYSRLEYPAQKLGSALQKVNFLRDIKEDRVELGRTYFPEITNNKFDEESKKLIELSIEKDFEESWIGVRQLPGRAKLAVGVAFFYYWTLFEKIRSKKAEKIMSERVRISNFRKLLILSRVVIMYNTNII